MFTQNLNMVWVLFWELSLSHPNGNLISMIIGGRTFLNGLMDDQDRF